MRLQAHPKRSCLSFFIRPAYRARCLAHSKYILDATSPVASKHSLTMLTPFSIKADAPGGLVQLDVVPNYDLPNPDSIAGKIIGWSDPT